MQNLPNDVDSLTALVKQLLEKIKQFQVENAELRRRLGLDSSNSDKPPSRNGYKKKIIQPGLLQEKKPKNGGQKGHQGKTLHRVEQPDRIEIHLPSQCQCCGWSWGPDNAYKVIQRCQVVDLPEPKLEVTEPQRGSVECCGMQPKGKYPAVATTSVQYGIGVRALSSLIIS
jgi:hypothetical protein